MDGTDTLGTKKLLTLDEEASAVFYNGGNLAYGQQLSFTNSVLGANYASKISTSHSSSSGAANNLLFSLNSGKSGTYINTLVLTGDGKAGFNLAALPSYTIEASGDIKSNKGRFAGIVHTATNTLSNLEEGEEVLYVP